MACPLARGAQKAQRAREPWEHLERRLSRPFSQCHPSQDLLCPHFGGRIGNPSPENGLHFPKGVKQKGDIHRGESRDQTMNRKCQQHAVPGTVRGSTKPPNPPTGQSPQTNQTGFRQNTLIAATREPLPTNSPNPKFDPAFRASSLGSWRVLSCRRHLGPSAF